MPGLRRSDLRLWLAPALLAATIVAFVGGSSSVSWVTEAARTSRWVVLLALLVVALWVARDRLRSRDLRDYAWIFLAPAAFVMLAAVSAAWSSAPGLTFARSASLAILVLAASSLGYWAAGDRGAIERLCIGIVAGVAFVALIGVVLLVVGSDAAVQEKTSQTGWRFQGLGMNPNTVSMLTAVALPPATLLAAQSRSRYARTLGILAIPALYFTIVFSESRGAMLASLVGMLIVTPFVLSGVPQRAIAVSLVVIAFVGGNVLRASNPGPPVSPERSLVLPSLNPLLGDPVAPAPGGKTGEEPGPGGNPDATPGTGGKGGGVPRPGGEDGEPPATGGKPGVPQSERFGSFPRFRGEAAVRPEDEIGHPIFADELSTVASGRVAAWKGALELIRERPLLGYGFGTESRTFVDRWYYFQGGNPENAYLGLLLQLGGFGLGLFLAIGLAVIVLAIRALRRPSELRGSMAALLATGAAGAVLMTAQSYVYAVGNVATVTVWVATVALAATAMHVLRAHAVARKPHAGGEPIRDVGAVH